MEELKSTRSAKSNIEEEFLCVKSKCESEIPSSI